jgi:hypothetical protein
MRKVRFSIAALMGAVLVAALGLAVLRYGSQVSAGVLFLLTCGVLCLGVVGIVCRSGAERAWWLGFTLFGWGYMTLAFWFAEHLNELPTTTLLVALGLWLGIPTPGYTAGSRTAGLDPSYALAGHCCWTLLAAVIGGILAWTLFGGPARDLDRSITAAQGQGQDPRGWWRRPAVIGLVAFVLVVLVAVAGARLAPGLWAGATFLLTCALLAFSTLCALCGRGRCRQVWLGAALFGAGYMVLTFGRSPDQPSWPSIPTDHFLNALRPGPPPVVGGFPISSHRIDSTKERILQELERPVPMRFPNQTPLDDVLKHIVDATRGADGKGIPIYVDPVGLQEAQKNLTSPVSIEVEGVPLKHSLSKCLKQLGLAYSVRDGYVMISAEGAVIPVYDDPFLIVGHCLLALIAAGLGGVLGPLASDLRGEPPGRVSVN